MGHGSLLAGRYRLEERVRTGADGSLWRAVDETLDRPVSVRIVRPGHRCTADVIDAARRAALVEDARLVRVLDVGESGGSAYIVSEHLVGRTLEEILTRGPLPAETARRLVGEAAQALERASARGLHHLQLTSASVVVAPDGTVKVLGTAVEAALAGVEQDEDPVGADRLDAVGLVRVLYAALTGRWPGRVDGPLGPAPVATGRAAPPGDVVEGVPNDLDTLCTVTLGPHEDGPHSPGDLARQLAPWGHPEPITGPRGMHLAGAGRSGNELSAGVNGTAVASGVNGAEVAGADVVEADDLVVETGVAPGPAARDDASAPPQVIDLTGSSGAAPTPPVPTPPVPAGAVASSPASTSSGSSRTPASSGSSAGSSGSKTSRHGPNHRAAHATGGIRLGGGHGGHGGHDGHGNDQDDWALLSAPEHSTGGIPVDAEPLGPFIPPAPVARPSRDQARFVIAVVTALGVLGLILAVFSLRGLFGADDTVVEPAPLVPTATTPAARSAAAAAPKPAAAPAATPSGPAGAITPAPTDSPAEISGIQAIDPQGDGDENGSTADRAIDGDPDSTWRSARYQSATFGGLKHGLGLYLQLGDGAVSSVTVEMSGQGGAVELRTANGPGLDSSTVVATAQAQDGRSVLTPARPLPGGPLLLWFTNLPQQSNGEYRLVVSEITVS